MNRQDAKTPRGRKDKLSEYSAPMSLEVERGVYQSLLMRIEAQEKEWVELMNIALANGDDRGAQEAQLWLNQLKRQRETLRKPGEPRRGT